ncbi:MAG TPA: thiolase domain-containing protein [Candidatus Thermoplasmatota archaeon]|nr:thiolase domain-containing protein [Candidatus Thermoplasmatota archaeon]
MRDVAIIGQGMTKFGELWERSLRQLVTEAGLAAVKDAGVPGDRIDAMYVGSMSAGRFVGQEHVGALVVDEAGLAHHHIPSTRIEAADASGGVALRQGYLAVASGDADVVVVGGVEKMTDVIDQEQTNTLATVLDQEWEAFFGATFPSVYALMAQRHAHKYGTTAAQLAAVSVKNHEHGAMNPNAAYPFAITKDAVLKSPMVADPLRMLDCAANLDGAAAVVLCAADKVAEFTRKDRAVKILASHQASDTLAMHDRASITELAATKHAAKRAYERARLTPADIDVAEVHDAFTIAEILAIEDLGFYAKGSGGAAAEKGLTSWKGEKPVNTSGGLKARGHPPGATGVAQAAEIVQQLRGEAGKRQVADAEIGLAHNVGGSGGTAVVTIFGRMK